MKSNKSALFFFFTLVTLGIGCQAHAEYDVVIEGARVIDPESGLDAISNVAITGNVVAAITTTDITGKRVIDARGLIAAPGFIDLHAHGQDADITLFDPKEVAGVADYKPGTNSLPSKGFRYVLVNGKIVVDDGALVDGVFAGAPIRGEVSNAR